MFERYTQTARRVIFSARYVASRVGSPEIETEHLLLGLLREDKGLARRFLGSPWAAEEIWKEIEGTKPARDKKSGPVELPLTGEGKRILVLAAKEADVFSHKQICTAHLLIALLREETCLAAELLHRRGISVESIRGELANAPHDDSINEKFVREPRSLTPDVVELQAAIKSTLRRMQEAIANQDFVKAQACSEEEGRERDKLYLLYQKYGLSDWICD
jgi:ATP-dependent Clp protease ATP-binding subunit ClpC